MARYSIFVETACIYAILSEGKKKHVILYIIKIKIHSSCDIEYFVETHLCKLCVYIVHVPFICRHLSEKKVCTFRELICPHPCGEWVMIPWFAVTDVLKWWYKSSVQVTALASPDVAVGGLHALSPPK